MMDRFKICLLLIIVGFLITKSNAQSGWLRAKKGYYTQASVSYFSSEDYFSLAGEKNPNGNRFSSIGLQWYGEYGWTDKLTLISTIPLLKFNQFNTTKSAIGIGDVRVGVKYGLFQQLPVSISVEAEIPTGDGVLFADEKSANALGIVEQINLPTSDGEFNVLSTIAVSSSTKNGNIYGSIFGTLNLRTASFSHQVRLGTEVGHRFFEKLWLIGKLNLQESLSETPNKNVSFLYGEGTTYTAYGLTAVYHLPKQWRLVATYYDYAGFLVAKKNIYDGPSFSLGIASEL